MFVSENKDIHDGGLHRSILKIKMLVKGAEQLLNLYPRFSSLLKKKYPL